MSTHAAAARRATARRTGVLLALAALPLAVIVLFFALPVAAMVLRGLAPDGALDLGGVLETLQRERTRRVIGFTVFSALAGTVLSVLLGLPAAFALHRLRFPGVAAIRSLLLVPFVLPTVVVGVAFRGLLGEGGLLGFLGLDRSATAIVSALVFFNVAVVIRVVGGAWASLDERPAQAAAALGASPRQVWWQVTLPALRPAIVSAATVVFLFCSTAFGVVLTLGGLRYATVETEIYLLTRSFDLSAAATLSVLQVLGVAAMLLVVQRLRRTPDPTVSRVPPSPRRPRRGDAGALAATGLLLVLVALPLAGLVSASLRVDDAWSLDNYRRVLAGPDGDLGSAMPVPLGRALVNSLQIAGDATMIAVALGLLVAAVVTRRARSRLERGVRGALDGFFMLPLGVSAVTVGFGLLITVARPPLALRDEPILVPLAQALVALPLVVRTLVPVLEGVDDRLRQAAASLGAPPWRVPAVVDLPVMWRPLLAAAGFAFAVSLGEFGATAFLASAERPTVPVVIARLISSPGADMLGAATAAAVVLALATSTVMLITERLRVPSLGAW